MTARAGAMRLPDVQSLEDHRGLCIDSAGIRHLRHPVRILAGGRDFLTIARFSMSVALPASSRGTHMSRFVELLEEQTEALDVRGFRELVVKMVERLGATSGEIAMRFPLFLEKRAPVSRVRSLLDYEACWNGAVRAGAYGFRIGVVVPVTSLCPCSKEISSYGAHNQRSVIRIQVETRRDVDMEELIKLAERSASCELYGLLKRADERFVTERAYDNPKFAEDLVRDLALELGRDERIRRYSIEAENLESIHNHSAYARISGPAGKAE